MVEELGTSVLKFSLQEESGAETRLPGRQSVLGHRTVGLFPPTLPPTDRLPHQLTDLPTAQPSLTDFKILLCTIFSQLRFTVQYSNHIRHFTSYITHQTSLITEFLHFCITKITFIFCYQFFNNYEFFVCFVFFLIF